MGPARRRERCSERRIAESGLPVRKTLANFDWAFLPKLERAALEELAGLGFFRHQRDLLITGQPGTGKSPRSRPRVRGVCRAG